MGDANLYFVERDIYCVAYIKVIQIIEPIQFEVMHWNIMWQMSIKIANLLPTLIDSLTGKQAQSAIFF